MATARVSRKPPLSRMDRSVARGVASPSSAAGNAKPVDSETAMLQPPDVTSVIFVDRSGRRARRLRRAAYAMVAVVLAVLSAFWLLQGLDVLGVMS